MIMKKKVLLCAAAISLALCCSVGGTLAWLSAKTAPVRNTFTIGDIDIDLTETTGETYIMVPGNDLAKDPKVTVKAGSEDCWLFIKIEKSDNFDDFLTYTVAGGWTALPGENGVYYREIPSADTDTELSVLMNDLVTVKEEVTKQQFTEIEDDLPFMTFTAYAVQRDNLADAATAWAKVSA